MVSASTSRYQQSLFVERLQQIRLLKKGIWAYFFLLVFEGALRKWFLPGLATPLLIVRDPIAMWLLYTTWKYGLLPSIAYIQGMMVISLIGVVAAMALGHGSLPVALYGVRILVLHFPLMFVIGQLFNRNDVIRLGRVTLWIALPMTVLITLQFYSPQSAWVNRGVGGDTEGAGFSGALGYFRPPATFSFTNGTTLFYSFAATFIVYFWLYPKAINRLLLSAATVCLLMAIPLSISRGLFFQVGITVAFALLALINKPKYIGQLILASAVMLIVLGLLSQSGLFATATDAFFRRFEVAGKTEGGVEAVFLDRYLGGLVGALASSADQPLFGHGLGMGTNVGSMLLSGSQRFLISEDEWGRLVGELGPLLGLSVIFIRLHLTAKLVWAAYRNLKSGDLLPWLLFSFGLFIIPQGGWSQPTALGFCVLIGGLIIASFRRASNEGVAPTT